MVCDYFFPFCGLLVSFAVRKLLSPTCLFFFFFCCLCSVSLLIAFFPSSSSTPVSLFQQSHHLLPNYFFLWTQLPGAREFAQDCFSFAHGCRCKAERCSSVMSYWLTLTMWPNAAVQACVWTRQSLRHDLDFFHLGNQCVLVECLLGARHMLCSGNNAGTGSTRPLSTSGGTLLWGHRWDTRKQNKFQHTFR